jgi:hypothetical protein
MTNKKERKVVAIPSLKKTLRMFKIAALEKET